MERTNLWQAMLNVAVSFWAYQHWHCMVLMTCVRRTQANAVSELPISVIHSFAYVTIGIAFS